MSRVRLAMAGGARDGALATIREQIDGARAAKKCHSCGCFHQTVRALAERDDARAIAPALIEAQRVLEPRKYDCLGCAVCYPAIAANAFAAAFPDASADVDLCPTGAPEVREGWPPLPGDYRVVRYGAPVAACTLNDDALAARLAELAPEGLAIVGTMRTENLGIERVILNTIANPNLRVLLLCGADAQQAVGHLPGQSIQSLFANGIEANGRIRGAKGKRPVLRNVSHDDVEAFLNQVALVSAVGETDADAIAARVRAIAASAPGPVDAARAPSIQTILADEPRRLVPDAAGYLVVFPERRRAVLRVEHFTNAGVLDAVIEGRTPAAVYATSIARGLVTRLDHAAYLGRELARAERALATGEAYVQDRAAGAIEGSEEAAAASCGCANGCGG